MFYQRPICKWPCFQLNVSERSVDKAGNCYATMIDIESMLQTIAFLQQHFSADGSDTLRGTGEI
jgi:hypothetical protein